MRLHGIRHLAVGLALLLGLAACQPPAPPAFKSTDITGASFARDFRLTDHDGVPRTLADFRGRAVALFFGYIHCPDVCPTTLADLARARAMLGPDASRVQVLFVTLDPARDTPDVLKTFVPSFDPSFLGLYGSEAELRKVTSEFKVVHQKSSIKSADDYLLDHSAGTYIFDTDGRIRLLMPYGSTPETIAHDLKIILATP